MRGKKKNDDSHLQLFEDLKKNISLLDPVAFIENYLLINGYRFDMSSPGSGWKYMKEIYRNVATQAENKHSKPIVILKGRQVGATVMAAALSLYFAASGLYGSGINKSPMKIMHLFPTLKMTQQYAKERLEPMLRDSVENYISKRAIKFDKRLSGATYDDTITEKSFIGFNKIRVDSVGRDADRIRGTSQDVLFFDEVQDMRRTAIENALAVLTATPYGAPTQGVQLYFGTPKQSGSYFWELWKESDKRFFELKCGSCDNYFLLYNLDDDSWLDTWVTGFTVKCPQCGFHQDKREAVDRGRWAATREGDTKYVGYHFNMMLNPLFTKEDVLKKYPKTSGTSERAWKNEVLGDFYSGAGQPLTIEDIENNAMDFTRGTSKMIPSRTDKIFCLGADWGDKDDEGGLEGSTSNRGKSYSAVVIVSVDKSGTITIENAFRLKNNDFTYKVEVLKKLFETFKIHTGAADYMWGADICKFMQKELEFGNRFLGCYNSGGIGKLYSYDPKLMRISLNKNMMIDEIFSMVRQGKIKFPGKGLSYEQLRWLREHCASMEVETRSKDGNIIKSYQKGATQNDGLMALLYAVTAYKYIATGGFRVQDVNQVQSNMPVPILGYMPRML